MRFAKLLALCALPLLLGGWQQGIDFRATANPASFPGDCNKCSYELDAGTYPQSPACTGCASPGDSTGIGWTATLGNTRDRGGTGADGRIWGIHFCTTPTTPKEYKIALPSSGNYTVALAMGDTFGQASQQVIIKDGSTTLATIPASYTNNPSGGDTVAADGTVYSYANWVSTGSLQTVTVTMSGTVMSFVYCTNGAAGGNDTPQHIMVTSSGGGVTPPPPSLPMLGVGAP